MNLYKRLQNLTIDPQKEYNRLKYLFEEEKSIDCFGEVMPLYDYIDMFFFRSLPIRQTAIDLSELYEDLGIKEDCSELEDLYVYAELLLGLDFRSCSMPTTAADMNVLDMALEQYKTINDNIKVICERTNHEIIENNGRSIIVEKNRFTSHAVELVDDPTLCFAMIEYNHYALKGHLEEKKKILLQISSFVTPILKKHRLKNAGFADLESDCGFLLNNFHIRHNNKEGPEANDYILSLSDDQLETWYDNTYDILLAAIIIDGQIDITNELKKLKKDYKWKT